MECPAAGTWPNRRLQSSLLRLTKRPNEEDANSGAGSPRKYALACSNAKGFRAFVMIFILGLAKLRVARIHELLNIVAMPYTPEFYGFRQVKPSKTEASVGSERAELVVRRRPDVPRADIKAVEAEREGSCGLLGV